MGTKPSPFHLQLLLEDSSSDEEDQEVISIAGSSEDDDYDDDAATIDGMSSSFPIDTQRSSLGSRLSTTSGLATQQPSPRTLKKAASTAAKKKKKRKVDEDEDLVEESCLQKQLLAFTKVPPRKSSKSEKRSTAKKSKTSNSPAKSKATTKNETSSKKRKKATAASAPADELSKNKKSTARTSTTNAVVNPPQKLIPPATRTSPRMSKGTTTQVPPSKKSQKQTATEVAIQAPSRVDQGEEPAKKKSKLNTSKKQPETVIPQKAAEQSKDSSQVPECAGQSQVEAPVHRPMQGAAERKSEATGQTKAATTKTKADPSNPKSATTKTSAPTKTAAVEKTALSLTKQQPTPLSEANQLKKPAPATATSKPKKKKMTFQDSVLHHMLLSFKPCTLKSLANDLKTSEAALNHLMLSLIDKNLVVKKDFTSPKGRVMTLYWANHGVKSKEVAVLLAPPDEINAAKQIQENLKNQETFLRSNLATILEEPSNEELTAKLAKEESELQLLQQCLVETKERIRVAKLKQDGMSAKPGLGRGPVKSAAQLARERCPRRTKIRINNMRAEWKKRKDKVTDFIDQLADGMEKKPKDVIKLLEIETDEMVGVSMPPKHIVD